MRLGTWATATAAAAWICAACGPPAPPALEQVTVPRVARPAAPAQDPVPTDPPAAYALGWSWWRAGRKLDAERAFHVVLDAALAEPPRAPHAPRAKLEAGSASEMRREGDSVAVIARNGVVLAAAKTGALERFVPMVGVYTLSTVGGGLVGASSSAEIALVDVASGDVVQRVPRVEDVRSVSAGAFTLAGVDDSGGFVELWDRASRKRLRAFRDPGLQMILSVQLSPDGRLLAACGGRCFVWDVDSGDALVAFDHNPTVNGPPAFSSDGRFVAYGTTNFERDPIVGTTFLYDRKARKVVARSHVSQMPTGFAFAGAWLAVGDLRRGCLLRVPSLARIACSAEVRPNAGVDDDLQETSPTFVASASALALETGDGSLLLARTPSMTTAWKGRARLTTAGDSAYLVDVDDRTLFAVGPGGATRRVRELDEQETLDGLRETHPDRTGDADAFARVLAASCHVGDWVFPASACSTYVKIAR